MQPPDQAQADIADRKALLLEGYNRGILPENQKAAVEQLIDRGVWVNTNTKPNKIHQKVEDPGIIAKFSPELSDKLDARQKEVDQTFFSYVKGDIGLPEATVQTMGKGIGGTLLDIGGEVANLVIDGWSAMIPDSIETPVVETTKEGYKWLANTDSGEFIGEVLDKGIDEWQGFKDKNPQSAKTVESVVNLGAIFAPTKVRAKKGPLPILQDAANKIDDIAINQAANKKRAFVEQLIRPKQTPAVKAKEALRTEQVGLFNKNVVKLTQREAQIADQVQKLGVSNSKSLQGNLNIIQEANTKYAKELNTLIAKNNTQLHPQTVFDAIDDATRKLVDSNPVIVGDASKTAERIAIKAKELIAKHPPTAHGLFKARKEFDSWVRNLKGDAVFDPKLSNDLTLSVKTVRESMNSVLDDTVRNVKVHDKLIEQARLYDAIDNLAPKAADEAATAFGRLWQNVGQVMPLKAQANRDLAVMLGMTTFGAAAYVFPYLAGGVVVGSLGVGAVKGATSVAVKKGIAKLISKTDDAIRASRNSDMIRRLRLDRAYLVDQLKTMETEDTEVPYRTETSPKNLPEAQQ